MTQIVKYTCKELGKVEISCLMIGHEPWFKARDITQILKHTNTTKALKDHVDDEDKQKYIDLVHSAPSEPTVRADASISNVNFVNESGLYALIFGSVLPEAKMFKRWVTSEVLPSIRKKPTYTTPLLCQQIKLLNETDLHYKVMDCIRAQFPEFHVIPGLGEMQTTTQQRIDGWKKGYLGGQPDLLILNRTTQYNGFAIELKTPKGDGQLSNKQTDYLEQLENLRYKTLVSNNYDVIVIELTKYYCDLRFPCKYCSKFFKSKATLHGHLNCFHTKGT